jgi:glutamate synthase domain-containing protein 1/glutamate synthase domain-containing protein 3
MDRAERVARLLASRPARSGEPWALPRKDEAEGGCGVIGMAASVPVRGRHLLQALAQMRNRGNGKGGGIAAAGLDPEFFGVSPDVLRNDYLLAVALLDPTAKGELERDFIAPTYDVDHSFRFSALPDFKALPGLEVEPPEVHVYFARVRSDVREGFRAEHGIEADGAEDEIVSQASDRLNRALYASTGDKRAFVLSHGRDLLVLKMVGYGDDVVRYYRLEDLAAHVWIGHHRYPTKGRVWHPGGAHPFVGMHEALVHNGDFANYASICAYLAQRGIRPLFLTDTEVAVLLFDLLHRVYGYPLEYMIEAMAPTTERDFTLLPPEKQRVYRALQAVHIHGSPDGPWFFLIAQSAASRAAYRLIGITDTSMLRPQVFALQRGEAAVGLAASEKQAIDAALESLAAADPRFWPRADLYWNARGGSHTDGGAFVFEAVADGRGGGSLFCTDKFGRPIDADASKRAPASGGSHSMESTSSAGVVALLNREGTADACFAGIAEALPRWDYDQLRSLLAHLEERAGSDPERVFVFRVLTLLLDRRQATGPMKRSCLASLVESSLGRVAKTVRRTPGRAHAWTGWGSSAPRPDSAEQVLVVDARGFPPEGSRSLARAIVDLRDRGFRRLLVLHARGHRFIGAGLGPDSQGLILDVYGSSGDYLGSGIDGAEIAVHGSAQDQLAQIMKAGTLIVHGDVGQAFMYGAKGGHAFVLGNAAGRPLINAVGRPRVVINGTSLDYLAESFMAGDPLNGGGFVIVNGLAFDEDGRARELPTPYAGGNLFSLASGGAIYVRDPRRLLSDDQLNGGAFGTLTARDWETIRPLLDENERLLGIPLERLLSLDGAPQPPEAVYRKIVPSGHKALAPEEAWVRKE